MANGVLIHAMASFKEHEWAPLPFDSNVLGVQTALLAPSLAALLVETTLEECAAEGIELVYWTPDAHSSAASHVDNLPGYAVTQMVELTRALDGVGVAVSCPKGFRFHDEVNEAGYFLAERDDLAHLAFLAGKHSRFRADPALTNAQFKRMYSAWLDNSISGEAADKIFTVRCEKPDLMAAGEGSFAEATLGTGAMAGFITVKLSNDKSTASIGLLAVSPSYHRRGVGSVLMDAAESWAQSQGAGTLTVKTQATNRSAVSFYSSRGFAPSGPPRTTYHIWLTHKILPRVRYNVPYITGDEVDALSRVVNANAMDSLGPYTAACERWLEATLECSKALLTLSATAALEQAVLLCDLEPGDEVIMPSFTFVSTANAVALRGAVPVFVDVTGGGDLNLDPEAVRRSVTDKTKAIIVVHYGGKACNMDAIMELAEEHHLTVIEDAAQAFLSTYNGKYLGTIGHMGCFSFHYTKNTICGEGGALLVNDARLHSQAVIVREKGTNRTEFMLGKICKYEWLCLGSSYVPSELCAAFLLPQLHDAKDVARRRRLICTAYAKLLAPLAAQGLLTIPDLTGTIADGVDGAGGGHTQGNGHLFGLLFPSIAQRQAAQAAMTAQNIQCLTHFVPLHLSEGGKRYGRVSGPVDRTVTAAACLLRLPVWPGMHFGHVHRVVDGLCKHFGHETPSIRSVIDIFLLKDANMPSRTKQNKKNKL
jgi:dTDP-4-amino-4,6-dideoxygalactose transaminase